MTDRREENDKVPSLLERQSRGGDIAEGGFSFQESVIMSYVPAWLAFEGLEEITRESMGDIEAKFFVPGRERARELIEVKNHRIMPAEFWAEVGRFKELYDGSPDTFHRFVLVGKVLGGDLKRLKDTLERVRGPHSFYEGTPIEESSFAEYAEMVVGMGHSEDVARFLFERVVIRDDLTTDEAQWRGVFMAELISHFPEYEELPGGRISRDVYEGLGDLLLVSRNRGISRREVERRIRNRIPEGMRSPVRPVVIRTFSDGENVEAGPEIHPIRLDWKDFFGGSGRSYPPSAEWDERLVGELLQVKDWCLRHRDTRRIRLTGTVEIPEKAWEAAARFVPEGAAPDERLPPLIAAAFEEWVRWMEGSFRPTSISELETSRAYELYNRLFLEEMPSADHLGGLLVLPMGRARYLMQSLVYRHGWLLRERRVAHIRGALEAAEEDEQGRPFVVIDPGCRDVFDRTVRALHAENKITSGLKGEVVLEGVRYEMGEGHLEALKEAFAVKNDSNGRE